jgi:hypothetical protein
MALQTPSPRTSKTIQKQTADVQLNLDFILSMFEIIQTRKKCDRSLNDHVNSKTLKQTEEFQALRALHMDVPLKASTVKGWFNGIYDLIEKFYEEQFIKVKFIKGRSRNLEQKKNSRLAYLVIVFKAGINEEIPGGSKFLIFYVLSSLSFFN